MGFSISWIAFKDKTAAQVCELLSLTQSGEFEEIPESPFSGTKMKSGWYVVVMDTCDHKFVLDGNLQRVSRTGDIIAASIEEHVMFSSAEAWKDGSRTWKVTHEGEGGPVGPRHLEEEGTLPEQYRSIKERQLSAQGKEDAKDPDRVDHIFDIPPELAEAIVGYKHDKMLEAQFEILKPAGGGLLSRLFGKN